MPSATAAAAIDVDADAAHVWAVLLDVEGWPGWSAIHRETEVLTRDADGRPARVRMRMSVMGIGDVQVVDHVWTDPGPSGQKVVRWTLVESKVQRAQEGRYSVTPTATGCTARIEVAMELRIPLPDAAIQRAQAMVNANSTEAVKAAAERLAGR